MSQNPENQVDEALLAEVRALYTPLSVAKEEIKRRSKDEVLKKRVMDFLDGDLLPCLVDGPKAVLARAVASPNFETLYFLDLAETIGLPPVLAECVEDKFVERNFYKYNLAHILVDDGIGKNGGHRLDAYNVVDFDRFRGKKFSEIETVWGQGLVDFHHDLFNLVGLDGKIHRHDFSQWFLTNLNKKNDIDHYIYYLAPFICHGILCDSFLLNKEEVDFTVKYVIPGFNKLKEMFGVAPLIVPMQPPKYEHDASWYYYPDKVGNFIKDKLSL